MSSRIVTQDTEKFALTIMKGRGTKFHKQRIRASSPSHRNRIVVVLVYRDTMCEAQ